MAPGKKGYLQAKEGGLGQIVSSQSQKEPVLPTPWPWTWSFRNCETVPFHGLSHPPGGIFCFSSPSKLNNPPASPCSCPVCSPQSNHRDQLYHVSSPHKIHNSFHHAENTMQIPYRGPPGSDSWLPRWPHSLPFSPSLPSPSSLFTVSRNSQECFHLITFPFAVHPL